MAADMAPIATVERDAKLEGKNMFMILAPRPVPTGPPKFTIPHHDAPAATPNSASASETDESEADTDEPEASEPAPSANGATQGVVSRA
jgi:hypothetical protein